MTRIATFFAALLLTGIMAAPAAHAEISSAASTTSTTSTPAPGGAVDTGNVLGWD